MPSTYILRDERAKIYIGSCLELDERYEDHLSHNTKTTKNFIDPKIVWRKELNSLSEARRLEKKIKKWKSRKMIELLIKGKINL